MSGQGERPDPLRTRPDYDFRCDRCGAPHNLDTSIPSVIWNAIKPDGGALCTLCIDDLMAEAGLVGEAEFYFVGEALRSQSYAKPDRGTLMAARRDGIEAAIAYVVSSIGADQEYAAEMREALRLVAEPPADGVTTVQTPAVDELAEVEAELEAELLASLDDLEPPYVSAKLALEWVRAIRRMRTTQADLVAVLRQAESALAIKASLRDGEQARVQRALEAVRKALVPFDPVPVPAQEAPPC